MAQETHLIKIILGGYFLHIPGDENYPSRLINLANITTIDYRKDTLIAYFLDKTHMVLKGESATLLLEDIQKIQSKILGLIDRLPHPTSVLAGGLGEVSKAFPRVRVPFQQKSGNLADDLEISVYWISHQEVKAHRSHYGFKNKDDDSDAFTIALCWFDPGFLDEQGKRRFLKNYPHKQIEKFRETFHQREQLDKLQNLFRNQLRQRLALEFPEICQRSFDNLNQEGFNPTLGHLVGRKINRRIPAFTVGIGISEYSQQLAEQILTLQTRISLLEQTLSDWLDLPEFKPYTRVLNQFCFGVVLKSLLLIHCYPIERFLINNKPYWKNDHDLSLRRFQAYLGLSFTYEASGDTSAKSNKVKKKWYGSDLVRSHLYAHALVIICRQSLPAKTPILAQLKDAWFNQRHRNVNGEVQLLPSFKSLGKDGICRLLFYEARLLYQELRKLV